MLAWFPSAMFVVFPICCPVALFQKVTFIVSVSGSVTVTFRISVGSWFVAPLCGEFSVGWLGAKFKTAADDELYFVELVSVSDANISHISSSPLE